MRKTWIFSSFVFLVFLMGSIAVAENSGAKISLNYIWENSEKTLKDVLGATPQNLSIKVIKAGTKKEELPPQLFEEVPFGITYFVYFSFTSNIANGTGIFYISGEAKEKDLILMLGKLVDLNKTPRLREMVKIGEEKANITKLGNNLRGGPRSYTIRNLGIGSSVKSWYTNTIRVEIEYKFTYFAKTYYFSSKHPFNTTGSLNVIKVPVSLKALFGVPKEDPAKIFLMSLEIGPTPYTQYLYKGAPVSTPYDPYIQYLMGSSVSEYLFSCLNFSINFLKSVYPFVKDLPSNRTFNGRIAFKSFSLLGKSAGREIMLFSPVLGEKMRSPETEVGLTGYFTLGSPVIKNGRTYADVYLYTSKTAILAGGSIWYLVMKNGKPKCFDQSFDASIVRPWGNKSVKSAKELIEKALQDQNLRTYKLGAKDKKFARKLFCELLFNLGEKYNSKMLKSLAKAFMTRNITVYDQRLFKINSSFTENPSRPSSTIELCLASSKPALLYYSISLTKFLDKIKWNGKTVSIASYTVEIRFTATDFYKVFPPGKTIKENLTKEEAYTLALRYLNLSRSRVFSWSCKLANYYWDNSEYQYYILMINKTINKTLLKTKNETYEKIWIKPYLVTVFGNKVITATSLPVKSLLVKKAPPGFWQRYWRAILGIIVIVGIIVGTLALATRRRHR